MLESTLQSLRRCAHQVALRALVWMVAVALPVAAIGAEERIIDREPYDEVELNAANDGRVMQVQPLSFPDRRLPDPVPRNGMLKFRLIENPTEDYEVPWLAIEEIRLYEQLVLQEAARLTKEKKFDEAFDHLSFLVSVYPTSPGLGDAIEGYQFQHILDAYQRGDMETAWTVVGALYARNPQFQGLPQAIEQIAANIVQQQIEKKDFARARQFLDTLPTQFGEVANSIVEHWRGQLLDLAQVEFAAAQRQFEAGNMDDARASIDAAVAIIPDLQGVTELANRIHRAQPQIVVGVFAPARGEIGHRLEDWASHRVAPLVAPGIVDLVGYSGEGGLYRSSFGTITHSASGLRTSLTFASSTTATSPGPYDVARRILTLAQQRSRDAPNLLAQQLTKVSVEGNTLHLVWRQPHVRPESLLSGPLANTGRALAPFDQSRRTTTNAIYQRVIANEQADAPDTIVERYYASEESAVTDLLSGRVDMLARVPSAHLARLRQQQDIRVGEYAVPTVHVLIPSSNSLINASAELRRALVYGIDRQRLLEQLIAGGEPTSGHSVVSGPFPRGITYADPIGYAYDRSIQPRPYEPRLAATLVGVAVKTLSQQKQLPEKSVELPRLTLAHPASPLSRAAAQSIASQLESIGLKLRLTEYDPSRPIDEAPPFDLRYAELAIWEPISDAQRLFGPRGELGWCTARMAIALEQVQQAQSWPQARTSLYDVHRVAHQQLDVIGLWQTPNHFAHRDSVQGIASRLVSLYQDVRTWQVRFPSEESAP